MADQSPKGNVLLASEQEEAATSGSEDRPNHVTKKGKLIYHRGASDLPPSAEPFITREVRGLQD